MTHSIKIIVTFCSLSSPVKHYSRHLGVSAEIPSLASPYWDCSRQRAVCGQWWVSPRPAPRGDTAPCGRLRRRCRGRRRPAAETRCTPRCLWPPSRAATPRARLPGSCRPLAGRAASTDVGHRRHGSTARCCNRKQCFFL